MMKRIKNNCKKNGNKVKFEFKEFFFTEIHSNKLKTTQEIINLIKNKPNITRKELAKLLNLTQDGIKYHLNKMKKQGKISPKNCLN